MKDFEIKGQGARTIKFSGECIVSVEALNHDDTVRCELHLYKTEDGYMCQRIDRPDTLDTRYRLENCKDIFSVYQFFGTEPIANYLYGMMGFSVPGMRKQQNIC